MLGGTLGEAPLLGFPRGPCRGAVSLRRRSRVDLRRFPAAGALRAVWARIVAHPSSRGNLVAFLWSIQMFLLALRGYSSSRGVC